MALPRLRKPKPAPAEATAPVQLETPASVPGVDSSGVAVPGGDMVATIAETPTTEPTPALAENDVDREWYQ